MSRDALHEGLQLHVLLVPSVSLLNIPLLACDDSYITSSSIRHVDFTVEVETKIHRTSAVVCGFVLLHLKSADDTVMHCDPSLNIR